MIELLALIILLVIGIQSISDHLYETKKKKKNKEEGNE